MHIAIRCSVVLFSSALVAQVPTHPQFGPFSTTGLGFAEPGAASEVMHYRADTKSVSPVDPVASNGALFSEAAIFASLLLSYPTLAASIEMDALSTGNDIIPIDFVHGEARIDPSMTTLGWSALFVSFRGSTVSSTGPMPMAERAAAGAGADVYSWITPGSTALGMFEDQVFLDVAAEDLQMERSEEIGLLDVPLALMLQNGGVSDPFTQYHGRVFFSLTRASAAALNGFLPGIAAINMSGATVFQASWSAGSGWGPITVCRTPAELHLAGSNPNSQGDDEELDALAANSTFAPPLVVYSVKAPSSLPQLLAEKNGSWGVVKTHSGLSVQTRFGDSDVDALCGIDPEMGFFRRWVGAPIAPVANPQLILSATQMYSATTNALQVGLDVHGAPPGGDSDPAPGLLVVEVAQYLPTLTWLTVYAVTSWNGVGTLHDVLVQPPTLNMDVLLRARFVPAPSATPIESSRIGTRL